MRSWKLYTWLIVLPMLAWSGCGEDDALPDVDVPFQRLMTDLRVESNLLHRSINYSVLLPEGYDESEESYPVVYLLHGYGDNETAWHTGGGLQFYVDLNSAETVPMIYVMPQGFNTYYINKYNGNYPYMDMFATELVPAIDARFRTKKDKTQRAVMGYSMGGYGALILPVMHPEIFTISVPLSMSFRTDEQYLEESQSSFDTQWAPNFGPGLGVSGASRLSGYFKGRSPFYFFDTDNISRFSDLKILVDCGDDEESLSETNDAMHVVMRDHNIPHEYRVRSGGHSWDYWKKSYAEALRFISHAVSGTPHPADPVPYSIGTLIGATDFESMDVGGLSVNVLKPADYATATVDYPVVYFLHDVEEANHQENTIKVFSLFRNAIAQSKLPKSILVEIPVRGETIDEEVMEEIVTGIDGAYRTKAERGRRVIMGNAQAGQLALSVTHEDPGLFESCFLLSAELGDSNIQPAEEMFYYLDITDKGTSYKAYHTLYMNIRDNDLEYEYRVRQGSVSYQGFLNGLGESLGSLKESLN